MGEREGRVNTDDGHDKVAINVDALERHMKESLLSFGREPRKIDPRTIQIQRVSHFVRRDNEHAYDPQLIAIGPFHQNNAALKPMKQLKWRYLRHLCERSPQRNTLQNYINLVRKFNVKARSYYSQQVEQNDNEFIEIMVLDGCFLIEFLVKSYMGENFGQLNEVKWNYGLLRNDLLLLENQFPFPILEELYELSDIPDFKDMMEDGTHVTLMNLAVSFVTKNQNETLPKSMNSDTVHHLLHVHHASLPSIPHCNYNQSSYCCGLEATIKMLKVMKKLVSIPFLWLLSSLVYCRISLNCCKSDARGAKYRAPRGIPNAKQLLGCGIKFEGVTSGFLFAKFCKETGVMKIAQLPIQKSIVSQFYNLIAFEQCNPEVGSHFTSRAVLMNNLINTPEDVAILKRRHIIVNKLGDDEEVVRLFDKLCTTGYMDFEDHLHKQLFIDVNKYCGVASHQWRAQLDYFQNPWATVSVFVGAVLLILTFLSTFYTMYAYHHPPS